MRVKIEHNSESALSCEILLYNTMLSTAPFRIYYGNMLEPTT